ncbi:MAG: Maltodextrin phosphorylase [Lentisphaerae bacterium ADurb.Bin242]|nr:MAG: Maltodextrin phosphorylase [Lentisphaerae bacterium ADurb.Bin242]
MASSMKDTILDSFKRHLSLSLAKRPDKASNLDRYQALALSIRDLIVERWIITKDAYEEDHPRTVNYISLEFLMGRTLGSAMVNLGVSEAAGEAMKELGFSLAELRDEEVDAGLGNGGLGRLAACFLDSMATMELPAYGYGIRYDYGIFRQIIQNGYQVEEPDNWLSRGNPWEIRRPELSRPIQFGGHVEPYANGSRNKARRRWVDTQEVLAMPYDMPIPGYMTNTVNTLRLWSAESQCGFNLSKFNQGDYISANLEASMSSNITRVLYPNDNNYEGRELRLKQQYFLVSATLQDIMGRINFYKLDMHDFAKYATVQLNDTHPAIAVPELMRLLIDVENFSWEEATAVSLESFNYTNHTLMSEALEKWPVALIGSLLPRHLEIIYEINFRFLRHVSTRYIGDNERLARMSLIQEGSEKMVRMAYLCVVASRKVNGVAALHTELLKNGLFKDFSEFYPDKFINVTNGITPRRFLKKANPALSALITSKIGDGWVKNLDQLKGLEKFASDGAFLDELGKAKRTNKLRMENYLREVCGIRVNPDSIFDVQVKRLHEYKRQMLNALHAVSLYLAIKDNPNADIVPRTILFGAKAAPGYMIAKLIIKFINAIGEVINSDSETNELLKVVFVPNYRVSLAEKIISAADLSEQISLAGTEASGTGNMKFALNGALTIGTMDGANIEIHDAVGADNIFIFGMSVEEVKKLRSEGYDPMAFIGKNEKLQRIFTLIENDFFSPGECGIFKPLLDSLRADTYMLAADFESYCDTQIRVADTYRNAREWNRRCVMNIANMGYFSSDRSIQEYADKIWHVAPYHVKSESDGILFDSTKSKRKKKIA